MFHKAVGGGATDRRVEAFNAGIDALLVFYAPDVICHPAPGWVDEKVCFGHDAIRRLSSVWSANVRDPKMEIVDVRDLRERLLVLALLTGHDSRSGDAIQQPFGLLNSDIRPDGTVGEVRFFLSWQEALHEVGLAA